MYTFQFQVEIKKKNLIMKREAEDCGHQEWDINARNGAVVGRVSVPVCCLCVRKCNMWDIVVKSMNQDHKI